MDQRNSGSVTRMLQELSDGNTAMVDRLFPLVYDELRELAHRQRRNWKGNSTMNTTALVHEAYLKLVDQDRADLNSRAHFFALASRVMRHVLIDYVRRSRAEKRGGDRIKVPLDDVIVMSETRADELLALDEALQRLERLDERQSRIVECRFFGGMTIEETAAALNVSTATVTRGWRMAQAWLYREIKA